MFPTCELICCQNSGVPEFRCVAPRPGNAGQSGQPGSAAVLARALACLRARVPARLAAAPSGDLFREIDERATDLRIIDLRIGADQADGAGGLQEAQPGAGAVG